MDSTSKTGLWTTIPYACMWGCSLAFSLTSDFLIRKNILPTAIVRKVGLTLISIILIMIIKIFNTISHLGPALCLLVIVIFATNEKPHMNLTLGMFILGVACMGALYSGFITNPQDIAPNFAGTKLWCNSLLACHCRNHPWLDKLYRVYPWLCCSSYCQ